MPTKDFIVAIELGSSKLRAMAGRKNSDGSVTVSAVASDDSSSYIRKGIVYNIEKTVQSITNIVGKLKASLGREISQVYVGVSGQSILGVKNEITRDLPKDTIIEQKLVDELMDANRNKSYADKEILDVAVQEYKVGNDYQIAPAGIQTDRLVGNFLNIIWRKSFYNKLNDCFDRAGIKIAELDIAPIALADCILDDTRRRAGCLLVDIGASTTTMLVYHKNILRHIAVIPLGSNNITKDLTSLNIDEDKAEEMKKKYGCAYTETQDMDKTLEFSVDLEHSVQSVKFQNVVEARMLEIIENVWTQVPTEYEDKLNGGIVLTGGGANLKNIITAFRKVTKIEKITTAMFITDNVNTTSKNVQVPHDGTMNTLLGLLMKGDMSCDGGELNSDIFNAPHTEQRPAGASLSAAEGIATAGRVPTLEEKKRQEEQRREADEKAWGAALLDDTEEAYEKYKADNPQGIHVEEADKKIEELEKRANKGNVFGKFKKKFLDFITEPEE